MAIVDAEKIASQTRGFFHLPILRQLGLVVGFAVSVAVGVSVWMWSQKPDFRLLYTNLTGADTIAVADGLTKAGIAYRIDDRAGAIMVPEDQVHKARLELAGEGIPQGAGVGLERLDTQSNFGVSQSMESARYQRALERELARTIASINTVRRARVHLALPKQMSLVRNQKEPTASVAVDVFPGRFLQEEQLAAISHMVAASIPNLEADQVTIIDQQGHLLTSPTSHDMRLSGTQFEYRKKIEDYYIARIEDLLTPIAGMDAVKAQVAADIDFTVSEQTQETVNPDMPAIRSDQTVDEKDNTAPSSAGVSTNLGTRVPAGGAASTRRDIRKLDKTISHMKTGGGTIRRLSVAVVVDDRQEIDENGELVRASRKEDDMARMKDLVKEAIGFDPRRGDSVNVVNASFVVPPEPEPLPEPSIFESGYLRSVGKQLLAIATIGFLLFGVLRPVLRELAAKGHVPPMLPDGERIVEDQVISRDQQRATSPGASAYETNLTAARTMAAQDPKRVAQVVSNWVSVD